MKPYLFRSRLLLLLSGLPLAAAAERGAERVDELVFDAGTTHQRWEGWGGTLPVEMACAFEPWIKSPTVETYDQNPRKESWPEALTDRVLDAAVSDLGLTRFRLEIGPQVEIENDNDDPNMANLKAFRFQWQDSLVEHQYLPLKRRIEARGEKPVLYVSYDLRSSLTKPFLLQPAEYAEMAEVFLRHLKEKHRIEPDYWSVINEPGNKRPGNPKLYAELTAAVGARLSKAGFATRMSGPECVTPKQAPAYLEALSQTPGALDRFGLITYHLYWDPNTVPHREAIRKWSEKLKTPAAQTEWCEQKDLDVARHIHLCLTAANAVAWERYSWGSFYKVDAARETFALHSTGWHIRQFSRHIRPGAMRVKMTSSDEDMIRPVGFLSPKGAAVVVVINADKQSRAVSIQGMPAGSYEVSLTAPREHGKDLPSVTVQKDRPAAMTLPASSVCTLAAKPPPAAGAPK